ncbi:hypothetical protein [Photorhabdus laumondii]
MRNSKCECSQQRGNLKDDGYKSHRILPRNLRPILDGDFRQC